MGVYCFTEDLSLPLGSSDSPFWRLCQQSAGENERSYWNCEWTASLDSLHPFSCL